MEDRTYKAHGQIPSGIVDWKYYESSSLNTTDIPVETFEAQQSKLIELKRNLKSLRAKQIPNAYFK